MKYMSCEGRLSVVYGYHFRLLHELRFKEDLPLDQSLNIPYFLMHSIRDMIHRIKEGKHQHLAHHGLIKIIVEDALNKLKSPIPWSNFIDVDREDLIGT